jgi:hypothetical protein
MARINGLTIIQTTADETDAGTDGGFQLQIARPGGDVLRTFPDLPYDERERGRTDQYFFDLSGENVDSNAPGFQVIMRTLSADGWLPSSIFRYRTLPGWRDRRPGLASDVDGWVVRQRQ